MDTTVRVGGLDMPVLGLGTLRNKDEDGAALVEAALAEGYRHIDTAEYYGNEEAVGQGLAHTSVPRDEIWVTTKILHPKAPLAPDVRTAAENSLRRLGLDHVEALLIHWPNPDFDLEATLETFVALRDEGKARTIGVSNFPSALLRRAAELVDDLAIEQVEYHPYRPQTKVLAAVRELGMVLTAHSPLAIGRALEDPVLTEIGAGRGLSPAQVALAWLLQQDRVTAIPGGSPDHPEHLRANLAVLDVTLSDQELARIDALADGTRLVDPPHGPEWDED